MTAADDPPVERAIDPRTELPGICGITRTVGPHEWICIAQAHDTEKQGSSRRSAYGYHPKSERHYMVRRWPNSDR